MLILVGAAIIIYESVRRLIGPAAWTRSAWASRWSAFSAVANFAVSAYLQHAGAAHRVARARGRRRAPAHRRVHLARRARRPLLVKITGAQRLRPDHRARGGRRRSSGPGVRIVSRSLARAGGRGAARTLELEAVRDAIESLRGARGVRLPQAAGAPGRQPPPRGPARAVPGRARRCERAHEVSHELQDAIAAAPARRRRADPPGARAPPRARSPGRARQRRLTAAEAATASRMPK